MRLWSTIGAFPILTALGCAPAPVSRPEHAIDSIRAVAVFPPNNRTADPLLIAGASFSEKYVLPAERFTVADALAAEARGQLRQRGFNLVAPELIDAATAGRPPASALYASAAAAHAHIEGAVLYIEIRRWEADAPFHPTFVIASVGVTLIDLSTGRTLWSADHPSRPVPTPGVVTLSDAYTIAARTLMQEMLAGLGSQRP